MTRATRPHHRRWDRVPQPAASRIPGHQLSCLEKICVKIIFLFNETERLKQELVNQTANNIILKDELNKLKNINN